MPQTEVTQPQSTMPAAAPTTPATPATSETPATPTTPASPAASDSTASPAAPSTSEGTDLGAAEPPETETTDLGAEDTPEAPENPAAEYQGAPESGTYEDFTLPDGYAADPVLTEQFTPLARELGLSQKGAQRLVDFKAKLDQHQRQQWGNHLVDLRTQARADPEIGGAKYDAAVAAGKAAVAKFGTPGFRKMLNDYGVGAHPEMIRFMRKIGLTMGETPALDNSGGGAGVTEKPLHDILYKDHP